ncbi:MAG: SDR family oxidoreductase [Pseudomonadota bacterium]
MRIAVVTGAAGGLGSAIAKQLQADGCHVVGLDLKASEADTSVEIDLTDADAIAEAFQQVGAEHGGLDILVNNAGTCFMSDFPDIPVAEFEAQMQVNFHSMFHCCQAAIPLMLPRPGVKKIVNISSNGAYNFDVFDPPHYRASKAAMDTMTKDLARRYATQKIAVNSIAPAMTETPLFGVLDDETLARAISAMPHGEPMQPAQIAGWVSHLAGPMGDVCSGNVIILNQGRDVR